MNARLQQRWRIGRRGSLWLLAGSLIAFVGLALATQAVSEATVPIDIDTASIELSLEGGATLTLEAKLLAGSYLELSIVAASVELAVRHLAPQGREARRLRVRGSEPVSFSLVADDAGAHRIELRSLDAAPAVGSVRVSVLERRQATGRDLERVHAEGLFFAAEELRWADQQKLAEAIRKYLGARDQWRDLGDFRQAAVASQRVGAAHQANGELDEARSFYQEALELAAKGADPVLESELASAVGLTLVLLGQPEPGAEHCRRASAMAREASSVRGEAKALTCLGEVAYYGGRLSEALELQHRAEQAWASLGDRWGLAQMRLYIGFTYFDISEFDKAVHWQRQALELARLIGDRRSELSSLVGLGRIHELLGEYQEALSSFDQAWRLLEPGEDPMWQSSVLAGLASVHDRLGESRQAADYWMQSLEQCRLAAVPVAVADVLQAVGETFLNSGDPDRALSFFRESLAISQDLGHSRLTASALRFIGLTYQSMGEPAEALDYYRRSLDAQRAGEDTRFEAYTLADTGTAYDSLGDHHRAVDYLTRASEASESVRDRLGQAMALYNLARAYRAKGDLPAARQRVDRSLVLAESLRSGVASHQLRRSFQASVHSRFELQIDLLMRLDRAKPSDGLAAAALEASERARARSLLDSLTEGGVDLRKGVDVELLSRERELKRGIDSRSERLMRLLAEKPDDREAVAVEDEIRDLSTEYDRLQAEIRSNSPRYAALTQAEILDLEGIQNQVLSGDTLLLEYFLGEEASYLWAVGDRELSSHLLPPRAELETAARELYRLLTARLPVPEETVAQHRLRVRAADGRYWAAAEELSQTLFGPVAVQMKDKRLLVVSDGALQYLPFAALPVPGRAEPVPMIVEHEIVNLPSASTLAFLRLETADRPPASGSVAILADPVFETDDPRIQRVVGRAQPGSDRASGLSQDSARAHRQVDLAPGKRLDLSRLIATRREAEVIVESAPAGTSYRAIGFEASRETAMSSRLAAYRIVHFATHGILDSENPGMSGVVLSMIDDQGRPQNGFLRLDDIYNLDLPAELVVLSACNSALGKEVRGEGLVGLVRGFMYAGAKRVVASLWKVDDEATGELMGRFYRQMLVEGRSPAAALRQAQIEMWSQRAWRAPFYWAAFGLQGESG